MLQEVLPKCHFPAVMDDSRVVMGHFPVVIYDSPAVMGHFSTVIYDSPVIIDDYQGFSGICGDVVVVPQVVFLPVIWVRFIRFTQAGWYGKFVSHIDAQLSFL